VIKILGSDFNPFFDKKQEFLILSTHHHENLDPERRLQRRRTHVTTRALKSE
jgi:hypothetical protein